MRDLLAAGKLNTDQIGENYGLEIKEMEERGI